MYRLVKPLLFSLEAEWAHRLGVGAARLAQATGAPGVGALYAYEDKALWQSFWGLVFRNPVGLAAGFDKNAHLIPFWEKAGFGFIEVGSVTARPSKGNARPRAFRLPKDRALINRMGLNNEGAERVADRLEKVVAGGTVPLGINLAKTHDPAIAGEAGIEDFRTSFRALAPLAGYVTLNISCPNTAEGKTFEAPDVLEPLLKALFAERQKLGLKVPVLVKLAPPTSAQVVFDSLIEEVVDLSLALGVQGFVATNTAPDRQGLTTPDTVLERIGPGGLSGAPLAARADLLVRYLYRKTEGKVPIIGVGGILSPAAAYARIRAGASLVQVYTGLVYEGLGLVKHIKQGLVEQLEADGFSSLRDAVGADAG